MFKINEFVQSMHGTVRLCLDFYTPVNEIPLEDSFVKTLKIFKFNIYLYSFIHVVLEFNICHIRLITRTSNHSRQNFDVFLFSLFFVQLSFVRSQISEDKVCAWIRGFTHYCWFSIYHSLLFWHVAFLWNWMDFLTYLLSHIWSQ